MSLQVYSTLTRKKEPFHKKPGEPVSMYVCGPTVYKPSHIGHMVGPVIFDTVKRYLTYLGYKVTFVVNITDVDDKLINRARELNTTVPALAEKMTADYFACLKALNVTGIDHFPRATEHIGGMIDDHPEADRAKGYAYGSTTASTSTCRRTRTTASSPIATRSRWRPARASRSNATEAQPRRLRALEGGQARRAEGGAVRQPLRCGRGRPGWHIECTCMAIKLLGETLDIHGGGLDLQFPHHENELAQSESLHRQALRAGVDAQRAAEDEAAAKMAGSIGNVLNVDDALKAVSGEVLRFFILNTHYRSPIDLGDWDPASGSIPSGLLAAKTAYETFPRFAERVQRITGTAFADLKAPTTAGGPRTFAQPAFAEFHQRFREHMDDDFNTGGATGVLFELVTSLNRQADGAKLEDPSSNNSAAKAEFAEGAALVKEIAGVLGLTFASPSSRARRRGCPRRRPHAAPPRPAEQPPRHSQGGREGQPAEEGALRPDRPDPQAARGTGRHAGGPPRRHHLAGGMRN